MQQHRADDDSTMLVDKMPAAVTTAAVEAALKSPIDAQGFSIWDGRSHNRNRDGFDPQLTPLAAATAVSSVYVCHSTLDIFWLSFTKDYIFMAPLLLLTG